MNDIPLISKSYTVLDLRDRILAIPRNNAGSECRPMSLEGSGYAMFKAIDSRSSLETIAKRLSADMRVDEERLVPGMLKFMTQLEDAGLLEIR